MRSRSLGRRRLLNGVMVAAAFAAILIAITPLLSVLYEVVRRGYKQITPRFFTDVGSPALSPGGGILHALVGSGIIVGLAVLMAAPIGLLAGVYLADGGSRRGPAMLRLIVDVMAGIPSIIAGLFAYAVVVSRWGYSGWAGSVALALIFVPIVTRTTEEALRTVPGTYREAALALGAPRWYTMLAVEIPAAKGPILTGLLLGVSRIAGETAPLYLTIYASMFLVFDPAAHNMATMPVLIYDYGKAASFKQNDQAWGAAMVLLAIVLGINVIVRALSRKKPHVSL